MNYFLQATISNPSLFLPFKRQIRSYTGLIFSLLTDVSESCYVNLIWNTTQFTESPCSQSSENSEQNSESRLSFSDARGIS